MAGSKNSQPQKPISQERPSGTNRLFFEKSPYLLQHAENPVDWYPWGAEAFQVAQDQDKLIFLSIGYSTCHWCHVMERESFEDDSVSKHLNENFISVKVDREERPDIDSVYMQVCQLATGRGGWPLTVILTPEQKPVFVATYLPKYSHPSRMGMLDLLPSLVKSWNQTRSEMREKADQFLDQIKTTSNFNPGKWLDESILDTAFFQFENQYDSRYGGIGHEPKFPSPHNLMFLLRYAQRKQNRKAVEIVEKTLIQMSMGGIFDHIGFGFHRYSTDRKWLVPHFEKMLYDQAMMMIAFTEAYQLLRLPEIANSVHAVAAYVLRELRDPDGGFYSAEDADSDGEEGKFYVWTMADIYNTLGSHVGEIFKYVYNLKDDGNYLEESTGKKTGANILHLTADWDGLAAELKLSEQDLHEQIQLGREKLYKARRKRVRPLLDDKILTDWNGLMISALAKAGSVFQQPLYLGAAEKCAHFVLTHLRKSDGSLYKRYRQEEARFNGMLDDYAFLIQGLLDLYEAILNPDYLKTAIELNDIMISKFLDEKNGGFLLSPEDGEQLIFTYKSAFDGAIPSGNSVAAANLIRLFLLTGNPDYKTHADSLFKSFSDFIEKQPTASGALLSAFDLYLGPTHEIVLAGNSEDEITKTMLADLHQEFLPNKIMLFKNKNDSSLNSIAPFTEKIDPKQGQTTAFICSDGTCKTPITESDRFKDILIKLRNRETIEPDT